MILNQSVIAAKAAPHVVRRPKSVIPAKAATHVARTQKSVIPAKAGIQRGRPWVPAFAGMTVRGAATCQ
jgi:hypothetical protein